LKEISRQPINKCPCCGGPYTSRCLFDWNGIQYQVCKTCGSIYQNPSINFEYENEYWDKVIDPDGKERDLKTEKDFKVRNWYGDTTKFVNSISPGKILDVGSGLGFFLSVIDSKWERHALDVSNYAINFIQDKYPDISVHQGILENFKNTKNQFDVIMFYHVIEHLNNPKKTLKILHNLLKLNGVLIVGTPNIGSIAAWVFRENFRLFGPGHLCLFNPHSLNNILMETGFEVFKREYPFWKTDYATFKNFKRMFSRKKLSPPFYGSVMTFYAKKLCHSETP